MAKDTDTETEKVHLSDDDIAVGVHADEGVRCPVASASSQPCSVDLSSGCVTEQCGNLSRLMSAIIALNTLMLGAALVSGTAYSTVTFSSADLQVYLIILMILSTVWMLYYTINTSQKYKAVLFKDGHAGPVWLRGGLVVFGILSTIMDIFKVANYVGYLHCESSVKVVFPVVQVVFIFVQTYFLWFHAKDCVELQWNLTRCGLMLVLSTNLVLWMTAVTEESIHQTAFPDFTDFSDNTTELTSRSLHIQKVSYGEDKCKCSYSACKIIKQAYYYLYPFNIEYSLFASCMAYVMWTNVGRLTDEHSPHHIKFHGKDLFCGPLAGILLVIAGLATFVVYEVEMDQFDVDRRHNALMMHFVMNIVIVMLMSVTTMVGVAIHMLYYREHASGKNPTRSMDVFLLIGASMGQFIISYFTIVAEVGTGAKGHLNGLNLAWAILTVIQVCLQNLFLIEGLHREPYHEPHAVTVLANPYALQGSRSLEGSEINTTTTTRPMQSPILSAHNGHDGHTEIDPRPIPSPVLSAHNGHDGHTSDTPEHQPKLTWKRKVLKEVCAFLLLANVILWIMPAFGARPQFDHYLESDFYKFSMWSAVVNIGLPFGIFYRMHSVASLFEVYLTS